jgi:hypothetical protein
MPIQYQPAAPVGLAAQAGRGSAATKNNAILAGVIESHIRARAQGASDVTQAAVANSQIAERAREFEIGQQAESDRVAYRVGAELAQQQSAMMAQQEMMRQRFEQTKQMQFLEFTLEDQKEQLKLRRAMSWIDQGEREGRFLPEEAFAMRGKVVAGLDHYAGKAANARIAQDEAQTQALQANMRKAESMAQEAAEFRAKTLDRRFKTVDVPGMGPVSFYESQPNKWEMVGGGAGKAGAGTAAEDKVTAQEFLSFHNAAATQLTKTGPGGTTSVPSREAVKGLAEELMRDFSVFRGQRLAERARERGDSGAPAQAPQPGGPAGDMGRRPGMGGVSNADKPVAGMEQPTTPVGKPFNPAEPDYFEKLDTRQKSVMVNINKFAGMIDDPRLTPEEKAAAKIYLDTAKGLYATYGDLRQMGDNARVFADAVKNLGDIETALARRPKKDGTNFRPQFVPDPGFGP